MGLKKFVAFICILSVLFVCSVSSFAAAGGTGLNGNESLYRGKSLHSNDHRYIFIMQNDGNLVLYKGNKALWASGTNGVAVEKCIMQNDGNLVLYTYAGKAVWSSKTNGNPGAVLRVQNDGNVVIYLGRKAIWSTGTYERN